MAWPDKGQIRSIFEPLSTGDQDGFFKHVADDVSWTVSSHTELGGVYTSKKELRGSTFKVLGAVIHPDTPMQLKTANIIGGSDEEWSLVELTCDAKTNEGLTYDQKYAWCVKWKTLEAAPQGEIVELRAYLDTALLDKVVNAHREAA